MVYSVILFIIRLVLAFVLWKTGRLALSARTRNFVNSVALANAVSLILGLFVYPFTTVLLIVLGVRIWEHRKRKLKFGKDVLLFLLVLFVFLKGPGIISLDHLLGNI